MGVLEADEIINPLAVKLVNKAKLKVLIPKPTQINIKYDGLEVTYNDDDDDEDMTEDKL